MRDNQYTTEGRIRFSEVDHTRRITLPGIVNYFQDCSTFQSEDLGLGIMHCSERKRAWILSSWQVVVERYPEIGEKIQTSTWATDFKGLFGERNFCMTDENGNDVACEKITAEEIEEMKKAAEEFRMILKNKDITEIAEADVRFHDIIYMATDNQKLILLLNNLREQMYRYRVEYLKREEAHPQLIAEHAAIIEYISKGEKKAATDVMCKHIDNQVTTVIDVIRTKQN